MRLLAAIAGLSQAAVIGRSERLDSRKSGRLCPTCDVDRMIGAVWGLDLADEVHTLMRLAVASSS